MFSKIFQFKKNTYEFSFVVYRLELVLHNLSILNTINLSCISTDTINL